MNMNKANSVLIWVNLCTPSFSDKERMIKEIFKYYSLETKIFKSFKVKACNTIEFVKDI